MNNISYISNSNILIKKCNLSNENLDIEFDRILKSSGIRSRSTSTTSNDESDILPATDSFKKDEKKEKKCENSEVYCSESSNFPNIPFGSTPPDTNRIRELYMQYMSHIQLKNNLEEVENFDKK
jgi:hypothetical protein